MAKEEKKKSEPTKNKIGRPLKYTKEQIEQALKVYFDNTPEDELTITGLAIACGFCSRQMYNEYMKNPDFGYILKRSKIFVEQSYEKEMRSGKPVGSIFALKNMGWTDRQELDIKAQVGGKVEIIHSYQEPAVEEPQEVAE